MKYKVIKISPEQKLSKDVYPMSNWGEFYFCEDPSGKPIEELLELYFEITLMIKNYSNLLNMNKQNKN